MRVGFTAALTMGCGTISEMLINKTCFYFSTISSLSFVEAGSEVSGLLGGMPSAVGYRPTLSRERGSLQERLTSLLPRKGP